MTLAAIRVAIFGQIFILAFRFLFPRRPFALLKKSPRVLVRKQSLVSFVLSQVKVPEKLTVSLKDLGESLFVVNFRVVRQNRNLRNAIRTQKLIHECHVQASFLQAKTRLWLRFVLEEAYKLVQVFVTLYLPAEVGGSWGSDFFRRLIRFSESCI